MSEVNRREVLTGAAALVAAAAVPAVSAIASTMPVASVDPDNPFGLVQGLHYVDWWDRGELESLLRALSGLRDGLDTVVMPGRSDPHAWRG